ncbi:GcrA cell cycle regulator [Rhizobium sp. CFBP 8762]|uniref:GcrA family cell cycle regulator n=1 Tax=Rhizobium sp. CFBP 8762 TaxID=2775279 RepID=UPI00178608DF|nr:GcrA family cell cycle regulator [Rhizobium sp. CFBP 8762]MBD8556449.1 GcrA cell cycle regulator [Rhizobium sp. CFBP 8762]
MEKPSTWTEARIETLSRLWADGRSASEIAAEMGGGLTRNAVIGKVHRLGLQQRRTANGTALPVAAAPITAVVEDEPVLEAKPAVQRAAAANERRPVTPAPDIIATPFSGRVLEDVAVAETAPASGFPSITLLELGSSTCRWPLGDPTTSEFRFCGSRTDGTNVYCTHHSCLAYQPKTNVRRSSFVPR